MGTPRSLILYVTLSTDRSGAAGSYLLDAEIEESGSLDARQQLASGQPIRLDVDKLLDPGAKEEELAQLVTQSLFFTDGASPEPRAYWIRACERMEHLDGFLRLRLRFCEPGEQQVLQRVRWELLRDGHASAPSRGGYPIARSEKILFARMDATGSPPARELPKRPQLRALLLVASPPKVPPIDVEAEAGELCRALSETPCVTLARTKTGSGLPTRTELRKRLQEGFPLVFLICHGRMTADGPRLMLEDESGALDSMLGSDFVEMVHNVPRERRPMLIVLLSCNSAGAIEDGPPAGDDRVVPAALAPSLAKEGVPAVLGMQGAVSLALIRGLMPHLLSELANTDGQLDLALSRARRELKDKEQYWAPVLFLRFADGRLWQPSGITQAAQISKKVQDEIRSKASDFRDAKQKIRDINAYKSIHDALQQLEDPLWQTRSMFAAVKLELEKPAPDKRFVETQWANTLRLLRSVTSKLATPITRYEAPVSDKQAMAEHQSAKSSLRKTLAYLEDRQGSESEQRERLEDGLIELARWLKLLTPRANRHLMEQAKRLPLADLLATIGKIESTMREEAQESYSTELAFLSERLAELRKLRDDFESLLYQHTEWQMIDDLLRQLDDEQRNPVSVFSAKRFRRSLEASQESIAPFLGSAASEDWAQKLTLSWRTLEKELALPEPTWIGVMNAYQDYYRAANSHFFDVDCQLKEVCEKLREIYDSTLNELLTLSYSGETDVQ